MKRYWFLLGLLFMAACSASASGDHNLPVPAAQARIGAPCATEGETGDLCVNPLDTCPGGGVRLSRLTCDFGHNWRCQRDPRQTCEPVPCRDSDPRSACDVGLRCPDGSPVPAARVCDRGQLVCTQVMPGCPVVESDAGAPPVETALTVQYEGPPASPIYQGRNTVLLHRDTLRTGRATLDVREMRYRFVSDRSFFNADNQTFMRNARVINARTGEVLMGPIATLTPFADRRQIFVRFTGTFRIPAGETLVIALVVDLPQYTDPSFIGTSFSVVADGDEGHFFPNNAVLDQDRNLIPPAAIEGNHNYTGNELTLTRPTLVMDLETGVVSRSVTRNAFVYAAASVRITADELHDQRLIGLTVSGVGNIGSGYRRSDFQHVVLFCQLYSQGRSVSDRVSPDISGRMVFSGIDLVAQHGIPQVYDIGCQMDSVTNNPDGPDRAAVTIEGPSSVILWGIGNEGVVTSSALAQQVTNSPIVTVEVHTRGELMVEPELPVRREAAVGDDIWNVANRYHFRSALEAISLNRLAMRVTGNPACISQVGLIAETGGALYAMATVPHGADHVDIDFAMPFLVGTVPSALNFMVRFNPTVDSRVNPTGCHSGDELSFSLASDITTEGDWDASYHTNYNVRAVGNTSGSLIRTYAPPRPTSTFVVR